MGGEEHVTRWTPRVRMPYWTSAKYLRLLKHSLLFRVALGESCGAIDKELIDTRFLGRAYHLPIDP
jgi:hypothetical protein